MRFKIRNYSLGSQCACVPYLPFTLKASDNILTALTQCTVVRDVSVFHWLSLCISLYALTSDIWDKESFKGLYLWANQVSAIYGLNERGNWRKIEWVLRSVSAQMFSCSAARSLCSLWFDFSQIDEVLLILSFSCLWNVGCVGIVFFLLLLLLCSSIKNKKHKKIFKVQKSQTLFEGSSLDITQFSVCICVSKCWWCVYVCVVTHKNILYKLKKTTK